MKTVPQRLKFFPVFFILIIALNLLLRSSLLDRRPMHGDEAVNAAKMNQLMNSGIFEYDPSEYHGPGLFYSSLPILKLQGKDNWLQFSEFDLRFVTVLFGILLLLLPLLWRSFLPDRLTLLIALGWSLSPALFFYSRYYIHETVFVFYLYAALFFFGRYLFKRDTLSIVLSGLAAGMAIAGKETWTLFFAGWFLTILFALRFGKQQVFKFDSKTGLHLIFFVLGAALVTALLFSSFGQNPQGLNGFLRSFGHYFNRAYGSGIHEHPWYYYFRLLFFFDSRSILWATEGGFLILFFVGIYFLFFKESFAKGSVLLRLVALISVFTAIFYSIIPYKTPWNLLPFWTGMIIICAFGFYQLFFRIGKPAARFSIRLLLIVFTAHLIFQLYYQNAIHYADPQNPYVYAHPTPDIFKIVEAVNLIASETEERSLLYIQVIVPNDDYWSLPWYLRRYRQVGWWNRIPREIKPAPVIIADTNLEDELADYLYEIQPPGGRPLYIPFFRQPVPMRPVKPLLQIYLRKDYYDRLR